MALTFIDCQGYAGAFAFGARSAGFQLIHKVEDPKGFGIPAFLANKHIFGQDFGYESGPPADWEPFPAELLIGNPPCSGFSGLNTVRGTARSRGVESEINQCMHDLFAYAVKVRPQIVIMESVAAAYRQGVSLMRHLAAKLVSDTGISYPYVTHVLQNNLSLGGCSNRPRYFLVVSQIPFGVEKPELSRVATLGDAISDLADGKLKWEPQQFGQPSWWSEALRTPSGVTDGHMPMINAAYRRLMDLVTGSRQVEWNEGEIELQVLSRYWDKWASLPESWDYESRPRDGLPAMTRAEVLVKREFQPAGFSSVMAWPTQQPARVLTGAGPGQWFNAIANRMPTHRECARIMGYPDWWMIEPMKDAKSLGAYWGKQTSVHPAFWVCYWAAASIQGTPGSFTGEQLPEGDRLIDVSQDWKPVWKKQQLT